MLLANVKMLLPLMAAVVLLGSSCGRLGYDERTRTTQRPDAGGKPEPDDDAGEP